MHVSASVAKARSAYALHWVGDGFDARTNLRQSKTLKFDFVPSAVISNEQH